MGLGSLILGRWVGIPLAGHGIQAGPPVPLAFRRGDWIAGEQSTMTPSDRPNDDDDFLADVAAAQANAIPIIDDPGFACSLEDHWVRRYPIRARDGTRDLSDNVALAYYRLLDIMPTLGGFIIDEASTVASQLKISRQKWLPIRQTLIEMGKLVRVKVNTRGGVIYLTNHRTFLEQNRAAETLASNQARGRARVEKRWKNKQDGIQARNTAGNTSQNTSRNTEKEKENNTPSPLSQNGHVNGTHFPAPSQAATSRLADCQSLLDQIAHDLNVDVTWARTNPVAPFAGHLDSGLTIPELQDAITWMSIRQPSQPDNNLKRITKALVDRIWFARKNGEPVNPDVVAELADTQRLILLARLGVLQPGNKWIPHKPLLKRWKNDTYGFPPGSPGSKISLGDLKSALKTVGFGTNDGLEAFPLTPKA